MDNNTTVNETEQKTGASETERSQQEEILEAVNALLEKGKKNDNTLTSKDISDALAGFSLEDDKYDQVSHYLESKGIEIDLEEDVPDQYSEEEQDDASREELRQIEQDEEEASATDLSADTEYANTEDPVRMYLKEIGRIKLLSAEDEIMLAKKIENGRIADMIMDGRFGEVGDDFAVTPEMIDSMLNELELTDAGEEKHKIFDGKKKEELREISMDGSDARNRLSEANLRLVVSIAKKYIGRGMSFLDLIQEGNIGLMKAVEKFDYRKGFKFSTYATWWIRQAITRAIADQARTIRIPVHMVETINKYMRTSRALTTELGHEPTDRQIAKEMGIPESRVVEIKQIAVEPVSLDTPVGDEEDSQIGDFVKDEKAAAPADAATNMNLKEQLTDVMGSLTDREREVLKLRFGLEDGKARTLEEVGRQFGVTRERIRQIEAKALRKLRHPSRSKKLIDFIE